MWLLFPFLVVLILVIIAGLVVGGIYTAVIAAIILIFLAAVAAGVLTRRARVEGVQQPRESREPGAAGRPPPLGGSAAGGLTPAEPATPEDIARERQTG